MVVYDYRSTILYPYLSWSPTRKIRLWATAGYGRGEIRIREQGSSQIDESDITHQSFSAGGSNRLYQNDTLLPGGATTLLLKSDVSILWPGVDQAARISADHLRSQRLRLLLEGQHKRQLSDTSHFIPSLNLGLRHDNGDGETGAGINVGSTLSYTDTANRMGISAGIHSLLAHDYEEWGVDLSMNIDADERGCGLSFSLRPIWGYAQSSNQQLWQDNIAEINNTASNASQSSPGAQLETRIGYGLMSSVLGYDRLFTPYAGLDLGDEGKNLSLGGLLNIGEMFKLDIQGRFEQGTEQDSEYSFFLRSELQLLAI